MWAFFFSLFLFILTDTILNLPSLLTNIAWYGPVVRFFFLSIGTSDSKITVHCHLLSFIEIDWALYAVGMCLKLNTFYRMAWRMTSKCHSHHFVFVVEPDRIETGFCNLFFFFQWLSKVLGAKSTLAKSGGNITSHPSQMQMTPIYSI